MGLLDEAIAAHPTTHARTAGGSKLDCIIADLSAAGFDECERLVDMLHEPTTTWGNKQLAGIIRDVCDAYGVSSRELSKENVSQWRSRRRSD